MSKIFLFGATGPTGRIVLRLLLDRGYKVKALARRPSTLSSGKHDNLQVLEGDVFNLDSYKEHVQNSDCVISVLGTGKSVKSTDIYSVGGSYILKAIDSSNTKLITITSGGVQKDDPVIKKNLIYSTIGLRYFRHIYRDMKRWEQILEINKDIDWICVRPTYLQDKEQTGQYRVQDKYSPEKGWKISRADLAHFIVNQIEDSEYIHKKPVVAY